MNVLITLSSAGASTGPTFNLYSDVDTYATPFETGVAKSALVAGYTSTVVPNAATMIRVQSVGVCTNYGLFSIAGVTTTTTTTSGGGGTTTTTTTAGGGTTTTTTTAGGGTTTTTTTGVVPTTTTTTTLPFLSYDLYLCGTTTPASVRVIYDGNQSPGNIIKASNDTCYTIVGPTTAGGSTLTIGSEFSTCQDCQAGPPVTTTTTTTVAPIPQWYQITNCSTLAVKTTASYNTGTFALNDRVTDIPSNTYRITQLYSSNPGGDNLFIAPTGLTGCGPAPTTTTTTTLASVPTNILVEAVESSGTPQDCLGTSYPVGVTTVTATLYNQYGAPMNAPSTITVTLNTTYYPCYGGSSPSSQNITITAGNSSSSISWDSSRIVDCGQDNCVLETEPYNCAASNTASLPWRSGTTSC